ncbi:hypothetical protein ASG29_15245 [Sphingomonas sp. Leaf412]|uniref:hypothetical protein n=1 Tax=Sphingomonas sp. Leaf412 TaxID=1736370 RepID=UPI0006FED035|nr:hypothetical protein [Sphingomonas sp. Leaf412]KQT31313.1 hypothetical protein ASG29_15245 [Sphingomonas sp. Leaf412]
MRRLLAIAALLAPAAAAADPLTVTKTVSVVSDPLGNANPRSIPGAAADYRTRATNPLANIFKPVTGIRLEEPLAANLILYVGDLAGAGKGPVEFLDGSLLGLGLGSSTLSYGYVALTAAGDALEFSDGTGWGYQPVADAAGYDAKVRSVRVTLSGTFATNTSFQLRYRAKIR